VRPAGWRRGPAGLVALLAGALLVADTPVAAQTPRMSANRICSAQQGWCPVPTGYTIGSACYCFVPPSIARVSRAVRD
jgi:hypothetical protein